MKENSTTSSQALVAGYVRRRISLRQQPKEVGAEDTKETS
jgi:hypothetical protein